MRRQALIALCLSIFSSTISAQILPHNYVKDLYYPDSIYGFAVGDNSLILKLKYDFPSSVNRFMVVGDAHHSSPSPDFSQTLLYELTLAAIEEEVDFVLFPGDLVIGTFDSPEEEEPVLKDWRFVLDTLASHNIRVFACRGNNDRSRQAWDSLFSGSFAFPANGPELEKNLTYTVEYENLCLVALDQYTQSHRVNQEWLDEVLPGVNAGHIFATGHESAFKVSMTNVMNMFPGERDRFWESLAGAGVDAYFCGHDHFYDHALIDDGDGNPGNDVRQVIVGTGGGFLLADAEYDGDNGRWTPVRQFHEAEFGYVLVEIEGEDAAMTWKHRVGPHEFEYGGDTYTFSPDTISTHVVKRETRKLVNHPNPFRSRTKIAYYLPELSDTELCIYDLSGRKVTTLVSESQHAGTHEVEWSADDMQPGIYFGILNAGHSVRAMKMILLE